MIDIPGLDIDPQPAFRGQHSVTYRARVQTPVGHAFHQPRAVKVLEAGPDEAPALERAFKNAARSIAHLGHQFGVATIWEARRIPDGRLALVTTWVDGVGLGNALRDRFPDRPAPLWFALGVGFEVARLLELAASRGVVHGDVRPRHILVSEAGIWLVDWAIDVEIDRLGAMRADALSPAVLYRAPERRLDRDVGPPADVFSLAAVVYRLLTGALPFTLDARHVWDVDPERLPAAVLRDVDTLIRRALTQAEAARPRAAELRAALQTALFRLEPGYDAAMLARTCRGEAPTVDPARPERTRVLDAVSEAAPVGEQAFVIERTQALPSMADETPDLARSAPASPAVQPPRTQGAAGNLEARLARVEGLLEEVLEAVRGS